MSGFSDISSISNEMLLEAKAIIEQVRSKENDISMFDINKILKGTFFVLLYGAFEKTVTEVVERCISIINDSGTPIQNLLYCLLSIGLDSNLKSLQSSPSPQWGKRINLFNKIKENENFYAEPTLMPAQQGNFKLNQIKNIWDAFGLTGSVKNSERIGTTLSNLADNRNTIAHGRTTASKVGGRYSCADLDRFYNEISSYCTYFISSFEEYIDSCQYIKTA